LTGTVLCLGVLTVAAQDYEITRSTIDGGGVMRSTGDAFELSGTIGQPDAGVMAGGDFELTGGFWFALAPTDCNDDGGVDLVDYDAFEACLSGPAGGVPTGCACYDVDQNGDVDLHDFAVSQAVFTGS
jgi:hypothetical protein